MVKLKKTMKMKKIYITLLLVTMLVALVAGTLVGCGPKADYTVGIIQFMPHGALDKANEGFKEELTKLMKEAGKTVKFEDKNAQGEQANNTTIADTLVSKNVDLIYAIATPSAQAAVNATSKTPILFNAVTDPVDAGLVKSAAKPDCNVSGCSDMNPIAKQVELMTQLVPNAKKFGVLFTAGERNSEIQANMVVEECKKYNITVEVEKINDINDIANALGSLKSNGVECVYIPTDNVLADAAATVHSQNTTGKYNLPIVCGDQTMTSHCGVATYGLDYYNLGKIAGKMAFEILVNGKDVATMPVEYQTDNFKLTTYKNIASEIGFAIPQSVIDMVK